MKYNLLCEMRKEREMVYAMDKRGKAVDLYTYR